jgi:hypothetical protein
VTKHNFDQTPVLLENFDQVIRSSEIRSSDPLSSGSFGFGRSLNCVTPMKTSITTTDVFEEVYIAISNPKCKVKDQDKSRQLKRQKIEFRSSRFLFVVILY